jgi:hypothetical protein
VLVGSAGAPVVATELVRVLSAGSALRRSASFSSLPLPPLPSCLLSFPVNRVLILLHSLALKVLSTWDTEEGRWVHSLVLLSFC